MDGGREAVAERGPAGPARPGRGRRRPGAPLAPGDSSTAADGPAGTPTGAALVRRIGRTPLLPLPAPEGTAILGKAEWLNPGGSVKDRTAWSIVRAALADGTLPERRLLDASSGNTAIAYAMLGAALGFGATLCVPANASRERIRTLEAYGAELVLTDALEGTDGAIHRAREMAEEWPGRFWYADQYGNEWNWRAHYEGTGPEVWSQTRGRVTHFVAGLGTTGTLVGSGRRLRELRPGIRIVAVQPAEPLHGIEGLKHLATAMRPAIYDEGVPDEHLFVSTDEARERATELAREAGLFVGPSSGAAYAAAVRVAEQAARAGDEATRPTNEGTRPTNDATCRAGDGTGGDRPPTIVTILPDGGERYLSDAWWGGDA